MRGLVRHRYFTKRKDARRYAVLEYWKRCPIKAAKNTANGYTLNQRTGQWHR